MAEKGPLEVCLTEFGTIEIGTFEDSTLEMGTLEEGKRKVDCALRWKIAGISTPTITKKAMFLAEVMTKKTSHNSNSQAADCWVGCLDSMRSFQLWHGAI